VREAQKLIGDGGLVVDAADPLEVIEQVMRYFYGLGVHGAKSKVPVDEVQKCFQKALYAASLAAPYRHARLSAVEHIDHQGGDMIDGIRPDASAEELRVAQRPRLHRFGGIAAAGTSGPHLICGNQSLTNGTANCANQCLRTQFVGAK
jgi:hypothetical protein